MKSTPRILVLYEGNPFSGTRGGDVYAQHLFTRLREEADIVVVNRETLGLLGTVSGTDYAKTLRKFLANETWRGGVLLDGSSFYLMTETTRMLKREGWGPIVTVLQEWLPARERTLRLRLHLTRYMLRFVHTIDAHVAVSNWLRRRLKLLGVAGRNIDVARPGVSVSCFESATTVVRRASPITRIVSAGVYHPSKGQLLLVEAMGELAKRVPNALNEYRVDLYGDMPPQSDSYVQRVRQRITELGLTAAVHLHQHISQTQLWEAFGSSDVFTFMAEGEGLPLVVLESMLHGCVPVVPHASPMVELLDGGKFGVAAALNPRGLATALESVRRRLRVQPHWPSDIAQQARSTTLRWPDAVNACAGHVLTRLGIT